jgi:hypothetical protein
MNLLAKITAIFDSFKLSTFQFSQKTNEKI